VSFMGSSVGECRSELVVEAYGEVVGVLAERDSGMTACDHTHRVAKVDSRGDFFGRRLGAESGVQRPLIGLHIRDSDRVSAAERQSSGAGHTGPGTVRLTVDGPSPEAACSLLIPIPLRSESRTRLVSAAFKVPKLASSPF